MKVSIYFNPRSREGSDAKENGVKVVSYISIHAPAKGATNSCGCESFGLDISIHAPAKGATISALRFFLPSCHFNPRSREGSDMTVTLRSFSETNFNPRSREGSDGPYTALCLPLKHFNPRSREGSDGRSTVHRLLIQHFNPRSREGSDPSS